MKEKGKIIARTKCDIKETAQTLGETRGGEAYNRTAGVDEERAALSSSLSLEENQQLAKNIAASSFSSIEVALVAALS